MTWTSWTLAVIIAIAFIFGYNPTNRFTLIKQLIKRDHSEKSDETKVDEKELSDFVTRNTKEAKESWKLRKKMEIDENSNLIEKKSTKAAKGGCEGTEENKSSITEERLDINQPDYDNT